MNDLEVRQLRYFVAVAEELNFGRAAARLQMAQPPLSRAIKDLERQLGVCLFERTTRQVELSAAGRVLLTDARAALQAVAVAANRARHAGQPTPSVRLALKADYDAGLLPRILDAYRQLDGAQHVEVILGGRGEQITALREGRADVAILPRPFDETHFDVEPLLTEPRVVALAADDPLAARTSLRLADLAGRSLPDGAPADQGGAGAPDRVPSRRLDFAEIFNLIEIGEIVWFPPVSVARRHSRTGIAYRPVDDLTPSTLVLAWPQDSRSPAVAALVLAATTTAAAVRSEPSLEPDQLRTG